MTYTTAQQSLAEFVGTFALTFIGAGSIIVAASMSDPAGSGLITVALAHGLAIAVMVTAVGHVSGGHFNPAVTFGALITGKIGVANAISHWLSQLAGAIVGAAILRGTIAEEAWRQVALGVPALNLDLISVGGGIVIEAVLTFLLVWVIFGSAMDPDSAFKPVAGLAIGLTVALDIMMGGPLTGAAMNPARAIGPAIVGGTWDYQWVWWIGPLMGAAIAALLYDLVVRRRTDTAVRTEP